MIENVELAKMLSLGLAAGVLSGLFGIGGGLVIVPALVVVFGLPIKTAVGTSLFALLLPTGLLGVLEYWRSGNLRPSAGLCIALGLFFGAYLGAHFAATISQTAVKRLYAIFLLIVAVYFLISPNKAPASRAEAAAKPVPPEATGASSDPATEPR